MSARNAPRKSGSPAPTAAALSQGRDPTEELAAFLGENGDPAAFWAKVKTNLQARRVRMVFVADVIPPELRRVVEFLNEQMNPAEVLALEIRQYVSGELRTLVPRVIGQTAEAQGRKGAADGPARTWDEPTFFASAGDRCTPPVAAAIRRIYDWGRTSGTLSWGSGREHGSFTVQHRASRANVFWVQDNGYTSPQLAGLKKAAPFDEPEKRRELLGKLNAIEGVKLADEAIDKDGYGIRLDLLSLPDGVDQLVSTLAWVLDEVDRTAA